VVARVIDVYPWGRGGLGAEGPQDGGDSGRRGSHGGGALGAVLLTGSDSFWM